MKAFITASYDEGEIQRLARWMEVEHEDWRRHGKVYFDGEEFAARIRKANAQVLVVEADLVHDQVLDCTDLYLIACCRGDPVNIAAHKATELGIPVLYTPARNAQAVAELTVAYMLCLARKIFDVNVLYKQESVQFSDAREYLASYERFTGFELGSSTVGIVGFGAIGQRVARILRGFGTRVLAYDPYVPREVFPRFEAQPRELHELLPEVHFLTIHCPLNETTIGLIGREEIAMMRAGAYLLNLARAEIVNEDALYEALAQGVLGGAALDVFSQEPLQSDNRFVRLPNVLVSPHLGGATRDVARHQSRMVNDDIERWLQGDRPVHLWNPEVWTRRKVRPRD
jgi:autoinducer 2 (AI-2) kinase